MRETTDKSYITLLCVANYITFIITHRFLISDILWTYTVFVTHFPCPMLQIITCNKSHPNPRKHICCFCIAIIK